MVLFLNRQPPCFHTTNSQGDILTISGDLNWRGRWWSPFCTWDWSQSRGWGRAWVATPLGSWQIVEKFLNCCCNVLDRFLPSSWQCLVSMYVAKHMYGVPCFIFEFLCLYLHCNLILHKSSQLEHVCLCTQKSFANVNCIPGEPNPDTRGANEIWVA